jgi:hypothetical protein
VLVKEGDSLAVDVLEIESKALYLQLYGHTSDLKTIIVDETRIVSGALDYSFVIWYFLVIGNYR